MTTPLHTIHDLDALPACLARSGKQDCLLLLEDAVYAALAGHPQASSLAGRQVLVLTEDLTARGLKDAVLADGLQGRRYDRFCRFDGVSHADRRLVSMSEHPFAPYIRILGKGPRLSRPLTQEEARAAMTMILADEVAPEQLGAFFCLLRVKTETPEELAGMAQAIRNAIGKITAPPVDIDWPSYAGKARRAPLFILAALLVGEQGLSVAMHGAEGHTRGRTFTEDVLRALGITPAVSLEQAASDLTRRRFCYVPMGVFHPKLAPLMTLKTLLGLRSPLHSVIRHLNPFDAASSLVSVFHPNYRAVHRDAAALLGQRHLACFKGDGGEVERRVEKPCLVEGLDDGQAFDEEWPALIDKSPSESALDPAYLRALWSGSIDDPVASAIIAGTAAIAFKLAGRAGSIEEAEALAQKAWQERNRGRLAGT